MAFMLLYQFFAHASWISILWLLKNFSANTEVLSEVHFTATIPEVSLWIQSL